VKRLLSQLYGTAIGLRNLAFDRGLRQVVRVPVPVISVGNITVGGTGKTPVVEFLAAHYLDAGRRPAVVTRGYRRLTKGNLVVSDGRGQVVSARDGGDEAVQIARKFDSLVVIADEQRSRGCRMAVEDFSADIIILDDAFQHRSMHRDTDIVVVDAADDLDVQRLLPAGRLREPLRNLRRADIILLSKCRPETPVEERRRSIARYTEAPLFAARFTVRRLRRLGEENALSLNLLKNRPLGGFCGIGNPAGFRQTLDELQVQLASMTEFADHHWYDESDCETLREAGERTGATGWMTTEKDATRLRDVRGWERLGDVFYPEMAVELLGDSREFFERLER